MSGPPCGRDADGAREDPTQRCLLCHRLAGSSAAEAWLEDARADVCPEEKLHRIGREEVRVSELQAIEVAPRLPIRPEAAVVLRQPVQDER